MLLALILLNYVLLKVIMPTVTLRNGIHLNDSLLNVVLLGVNQAQLNAEWHYAHCSCTECRSDERRCAECCGTSSQSLKVKVGFRKNWALSIKRY
jgi:hypothetical protein